MGGTQMTRNRQQLVPEAHKALDDMKYEIAARLGIPVYQGSEDYWGHVTTREAGSVGGYMTKHLVAFAEQALSQKTE
jgi:small acid-soluble spore protein A (major alpha-type SASP)